MSYGFRVYNNVGNTTIAGDGYNMVYVGRGTFVSSIDGVTSFFKTIWSFFGQTSPLLVEYRFSFTAPTSAPIVPFTYCSGYCCLATLVNTSGNNWDIYFFAESQPVVYCFSKLNPSVSVSGYGIAVYNNAGGLSYLSTQPHIIPKYANLVNLVAVDWVYLNGAGGNYQAWFPSETITTTNVSTSLTTPILYYPTPDNAANNRTDRYSQYYAAPVAKYDAGNVLTRWGNSAEAVIFSGYLYNAPPAQSSLCIVAEGSYFT